MINANEARAIANRANELKELELIAAASDYVKNRASMQVLKAASEGKMSVFLPVYQYDVSLSHVVAILEAEYDYHCVITGAAHDCLRVHW